MTTNEIRQKFIKYFESKGHTRMSSSSLIPRDDPSVLFTTAGMHPLVPYLLGKKHPSGNKLCDVQKCLRTDDIEEIGDSQHLTFFEMLGYWSLGDYFKKESIEFTFGFFTEVLGFKKNDISITVFAGDDNAPFDQESYDTWLNVIGIPKEKIYKYPKKENWWGPVGETGPCGPCTEMFIDTGIAPCGDSCGPSCDCDKFVEIGNNVFMEYGKTADNKFEKLAQKNVDVGLGLERLAMFLQQKNSVFEVDVFEPIINKIEEISGKKYKESEREFRIIADHIRAAVFAIQDGATPSNKGQGYIVRRLIRRAIVQGFRLNINRNFISLMPEIIAKSFDGIYEFGIDKISKALDEEEKRFGANLKAAISEIDSYQKHHKEIGWKVSGGELFYLYQTRGLPLEVALEELSSRNVLLEEGAIEKFNDLYKNHQEMSRTASAGMFKGGLENKDDPQIIKYHTTAHLLNAALREVLGEHVHQKGSNITSERVRFDFSHSEKMTDEEKKAVEDLVNIWIDQKLDVFMVETDLDDAKENGAFGEFGQKYGDKVKVYTIGGPLESKDAVSKEICGGPHVKNTGELGHFRIKKEESSSAGVRRIKAVLE